MNATTARSFKFRITQAHLMYGVLLMIFLNDVEIGLREGNGMAIFGIIAAFIALFVMIFSESNAGRRFLVEGDRLLSRVLIATTWLACTLPLLHLADSGKVWIVGKQTTLTNFCLIKTPFTSLAVSVGKNKGAAVISTATTKDGYRITGTVFGAFRLTEDEGELVSRIGVAKDPDAELNIALLRVLDTAFRDALAHTNVADLSRSGSLAIDSDVGIAAIVQQLGVRRNGVFTVSSLHASFIDR